MRRLRETQIHNSRPIILVCAVPGTRETERELHDRFSEFRLRGEWFMPADPIMDFVRDVPHINVGIATTRAGEDNHFWRGSEAGMMSKRARLQRRFSQIGTCESCDKPAYDRVCISGDYNDMSRENVIMLCRGCAMRRDGRMARFEALPRTQPKPAQPCTNCGQAKKPRRKGLCHACYNYQWSKGVPRPARLYLS